MYNNGGNIFNSDINITGTAKNPTTKQETIPIGKKLTPYKAPLNEKISKSLTVIP